MSWILLNLLLILSLKDYGRALTKWCAILHALVLAFSKRRNQLNHPLTESSTSTGSPSIDSTVFTAS
ncbi:hypothetical protein ACLB2K_004460 [Fragaria x ananassa]